MSGTLTELVVEQSVLAWLESIGCRPTEGEGYDQVGLAQRWRESSLLLVFGEPRLSAAAGFAGRIG
jgi:hypothetical protein